MFVDYSLQFCFLAWIFAHFHLSGVTALHGPLTRACRFVAHSLLGCISHLYFTSFKDFFVILLTLARSDCFTEFNHSFLESMGSCEGEEGRTEDGLEVPPEHPPGKGQEGAWGMERGPRAWRGVPGTDQGLVGQGGQPGIMFGDNNGCLLCLSQGKCLNSV